MEIADWIVWISWADSNTSRFSLMWTNANKKPSLSSLTGTFLYTSFLLCASTRSWILREKEILFSSFSSSETTYVAAQRGITLIGNSNISTRNAEHTKFSRRWKARKCWDSFLNLFSRISFMLYTIHKGLASLSGISDIQVRIMLFIYQLNDGFFLFHLLFRFSIVRMKHFASKNCEAQNKDMLSAPIWKFYSKWSRLQKYSEVFIVKTVLPAYEVSLILLNFVCRFGKWNVSFKMFFISNLITYNAVTKTAPASPTAATAREVQKKRFIDS